ncbi:hypothetical protein [Clostridium novyi]|uniref:hypothetical protein n=1 Tax=Clostridium novyi TaxID=1542 RepID=UPI00069D19D9|nr:hypothetical protein [Clostridium novyi]
MLENTLLSVKYIVEANKLLSPDKNILLLEVLKQYDKDEYIYPGVIISKLDITSEDTYKLLKVLEINDIISKSFEIYCTKCDQFNRKIYDSFEDIPDEIYCNNCLNLIDPIEDTIVIYKVLVK